MNRITRFLTFVGLLGLMNSCVDETVDPTAGQKGQISFIISDFHSAEKTKSAFQLADSQLSFQWSADDAIGIFPETGWQTEFSMEEGAGSNVAVFDGGSWALKNEATYYAYYPFSEENFGSKDMRERVKYSYEGQELCFADANGIVDLGRYDFMASGASTVEDGCVNFRFSHLGALCRIRLSVPETADYSYLVLESSNALFSESGYYDATDKRGSGIALIPDSNARKQFKLFFPAGHSRFARSETAEFYFLMPPVDMTGYELVLRLADSEGNKYEYDIEAKNVVAGMTYSWDVNIAPDYPSDDVQNELVTIVDTYYDGYKVHLTIPQDIKDKGNVIRYTATSLAVYNVNKNSYAGIGNLLDAQSVVSNGDPWGRYAKNDSTIIYNNANMFEMDKDGNLVYDQNGNPIEIHNPIVPGEPSIFLAGECRYGTFDEMGDILGYYYGIPGSAYVVPMFDRKTNEWTGLFQKKEFFAKEPTLCEATVDIEIPEDEITVTDANIYFNVVGDVVRYFYMVLDNNTYNQVLDIYLDGNYKWFQWFLTSYIAFYEWGIGAYTGSLHVNAASSFTEPLVGGDTYHVLCTVMGDDAGTSQRFIHKTFTTKPKTKRAPVVEINPVNTDDPYLASFNIKCTSAAENPLSDAYYAINYSREFQLMINSGYTYESLLKGNYLFSMEEVAQINSAEGLTISVPTLDGEVMRLAVYGCNDEYTFNAIDSDKEGAGWADYKAPYAPANKKINSPYYTALEGDWTASATIKFLEEQEDGSVAYKTMDYKSKVNIGNVIPGIPDQLEPFVYNLYTKNSKEEVDVMFSELHLLADRFEENRILNQNRLLCTGFIDYDFYEPCRMNYMSPYDLFKSLEYSSVDVPQLIYDFGPKWFFEVQEDGSLIVPYSSSYLPPMHAWPGYAFYIGGLCDGNAFLDSEDAKFDDLPGFPVEVSSDNNTITIKPVVRGDFSYYMNSIGISNQGSEVIATVISDIVLTRGWSDVKSQSATFSSTPVKLNTITAEGKPVNELPKLRTFKSMSDFSKVEPLREYKKDETSNVVTMDMVNKTTDKILKHHKMFFTL